MRKALSAAFAAMLLVAVAACGKDTQRPRTAFEGYVEDVTREVVSDSPELASSVGLTTQAAGGAFDNRLDDRSGEAVQYRRTAALRALAQLRAIERDDLDRGEAITYDVLNARFTSAAEAARFEYGRFSLIGGFSPYVLNPMDSAFVRLPDFLNAQHRVLNFDDAAAYIARLEQVAGALDDETKRARADMEKGVIPPDYIVDRTMAEVAKVLETPPGELVFVSSLTRRIEAFAGALPPESDADTPTQARARALIAKAKDITANRIVPAYRRTWYALAEMRLRAGHDGGVWRLPDGDAYYRAALADQTSLTMTPDEIHAAGLRRVRALSAEMDMMLRSQGLTQGTVGERMAQITADPQFLYPATPEGRASAQADLQRWAARVSERLPRWFRTLPKTPLEIRAAPALLVAARIGAYYDPPSLDGARPGVFFVNLADLGHQPKFDFVTLVHHEGYPGHHLQVSIAQQQPDLLLIRRLISFNGFTEGWALYAEQLADEMGLYEGDPYARLGYLRWQTWRAARLVVDTGIHAKHWSREQAIEYLSQVTGDAPSTIAGEVDRYTILPGQACGYELGRMEIVRLRDKARAKLGARFNIRDFHDAVLANADVPLPVLEKIIDQWIERGGGGTMKQAR